MLTKKFNSVLQFDTIKVDGQNKVQPVQWREFKKSDSTKRKIKEAGLENEIDDTVDVEATTTFGRSSAMEPPVSSSRRTNSTPSRRLSVLPALAET